MDFRIVACNRCKHKWATKGNPKWCPSCKSPYWNKPRVKRVRKGFCPEIGT